MTSLELVLDAHSPEYTHEQKLELCEKKNDEYLALVRRMTPADLFPGARELLENLRSTGIGTALASASKNGQIVVDQLQIRDLLDVVVDGNDAHKSKPDPQVFLMAAERLGCDASQCVVVEDAEAGVEAGLNAKMKVIGIGPQERVGKAHRVVAGVHEIGVNDIRSLLNQP